MRAHKSEKYLLSRLHASGEGICCDKQHQTILCKDGVDMHHGYTGLDGHYYCDCCNQQFPRSEERFWCESCSFDLCVGCAVRVTPTDDSSPWTVKAAVIKFRKSYANRAVSRAASHAGTPRAADIQRGLAPAFERAGDVYRRPSRSASRKHSRSASTAGSVAGTPRHRSPGGALRPHDWGGISPGEWEERTNPNNGEIYYVNVKTGQESRNKNNDKVLPAIKLGSSQTSKDRRGSKLVHETKMDNLADSDNHVPGMVD